MGRVSPHPGVGRQVLQRRAWPLQEVRRTRKKISNLYLSAGKGSYNRNYIIWKHFEVPNESFGLYFASDYFNYKKEKSRPRAVFLFQLVKQRIWLRRILACQFLQFCVCLAGIELQQKQKNKNRGGGRSDAQTESKKRKNTLL